MAGKGFSDLGVGSHELEKDFLASANVHIGLKKIFRPRSSGDLTKKSFSDFGVAGIIGKNDSVASDGATSNPLTALGSPSSQKVFAPGNAKTMTMG